MDTEASPPVYMVLRNRVVYLKDVPKKKYNRKPKETNIIPETTSSKPQTQEDKCTQTDWERLQEKTLQLTHHDANDMPKAPNEDQDMRMDNNQLEESDETMDTDSYQGSYQEYDPEYQSDNYYELDLDSDV